ncbi:hypothetical protein BDZ91DRAFT_850290 [Kalaharituber pfeilii]|nr:hypothetical protein BDZ91DRAFT_850290 [Kalaharituber pfeilii]
MLKRTNHFAKQATQGETYTNKEPQRTLDVMRSSLLHSPNYVSHNSTSTNAHTSTAPAVQPASTPNRRPLGEIHVDERDNSASIHPLFRGKVLKSVREVMFANKEHAKENVISHVRKSSSRSGSQGVRGVSTTPKGPAKIDVLSDQPLTPLPIHSILARITTSPLLSAPKKLELVNTLHTIAQTISKLSTQQVAAAIGPRKPSPKEARAARLRTLVAEAHKANLEKTAVSEEECIRRIKIDETFGEMLGLDKRDSMFKELAWMDLGKDGGRGGKLNEGATGSSKSAVTPESEVTRRLNHHVRTTIVVLPVKKLTASKSPSSSRVHISCEYAEAPSKWEEKEENPVPTVAPLFANTSREAVKGKETVARKNVRQRKRVYQDISSFLRSWQPGVMKHCL